MYMGNFLVTLILIVTLWKKYGVVDWCIVLVEMPQTQFEECWSLPTESLPELP